eukprot:1966518-Rhodomonas_salina.1
MYAISLIVLYVRDITDTSRFWTLLSPEHVGAVTVGSEMQGTSLFVGAITDASYKQLTCLAVATRREHRLNRVQKRPCNAETKKRGKRRWKVRLVCKRPWFRRSRGTKRPDARYLRCRYPLAHRAAPRTLVASKARSVPDIVYTTTRCYIA